MHALRITGLQARCRSSVVRCHAQDASPSPSKPASSSEYQFTYKGSDGRMKATFEQAFKSTSTSNSSTDTVPVPPAPWAVGYQMAERDLMWTENLKSRLITRIAAEQLKLKDEEIEPLLERLQALLPDIRSKLSTMKPGVIVQLLAVIDDLPNRLLSLKTIFPDADVLTLAVREPILVLGFDYTRLEGLANELRELLPAINVDRLVQEYPLMLDVEELKAAMAEAARIMPSLDVQKTMASDPGMILSFQRGSQLIPYDPPHPVNDDDEKDDDEYAAYYS